MITDWKDSFQESLENSDPTKLYFNLQCPLEDQICTHTR